MELSSKEKLKFVPIFYGVKPSELREEEGVFLEPLKEHMRNPCAGEVPNWKKALADVSFHQGRIPTDL